MVVMIEHAGGKLEWCMGKGIREWLILSPQRVESLTEMRQVPPAESDGFHLFLKWHRW